MSSAAPLFVDDVSASRRSRFDQLILQSAGPSCGTRIIAHEIAVQHSTVKTFQSPGCFAPAELQPIKEYALLHNAAVWNSLRYTFVPGTGSYGRTVTIHFGWASLGQPAPDTKDRFRNLAGYTRYSFGGVGDITDRRLADDGPFNESRDSTIFSRKLTMGTECRLYWWCETHAIGSIQGAGDLFAIEFLGEIEVFGNILS